MKYKFRIKEACRIAGVDRDRFNEAVAAGNYPCAPMVQRGKSRVFAEEDLVILYVYGCLLNEGHSPKLAGKISCQVQKVLYPEFPEDDIVIVYSKGGHSKVLAGSEWRIPSKSILRGTHAIRTEIFHIGYIRQIVQTEANEELSIIGEDGES